MFEVVREMGLGEYENSFASNLNGPRSVFLGRLDALIEEILTDDGSNRPIRGLQLAHYSFLNFRAGCVLVQGGASLAAPAVLRTSIESAAYAVAFNDDKDWWKLWVSRATDPAAKKKIRSKNFSIFVRDCLSSKDEELAKKYKELCDLLIDLGAHPSYVGLDSVTSLDDLGQGEVFLKFFQISNNEQRKNGVKLLSEVGVFIIAMFVLIWPEIEVNMDIWVQVARIMEDVWIHH